MPLIELDNKADKIKAAVVFPEIYGQRISLSAEARLAEAVGLAEAINLFVAYRDIIKIKNIKPATLIGQGVIDKLRETAEDLEIGLFVFDTGLTPVQQRNLEKELGAKVIDRTALILEIFGERAQTKEGKLQVELAHLTYQRSRLVRSWTHLERQRGGAGFLGGPGETQIELDRRIIDDKILRIKKDLEKVKKTRGIQRSARKKVPYPIVAFVGYTNAGKSTLFNLLSGSNVLAKDLLFATLDPSMRKIKLATGNEVILSDTVGFISDLPHELVMAFRATLEEVLEADLIVHIRDIASSNTKEQRSDVLNVLKSLGIVDAENSDKYIEVLNKIDLLDDNKKAELQNKISSDKVAVSAITGEGIDNLLRLMAEKVSSDFEMVEIRIPSINGKNLAWIYANATILEKQSKDMAVIFKAKMSRKNLAVMKSKNISYKQLKISCFN